MDNELLRIKLNALILSFICPFPVFSRLICFSVFSEIVQAKILKLGLYLYMLKDDVAYDILNRSSIVHLLSHKQLIIFIRFNFKCSL